MLGVCKLLPVVLMALIAISSYKASAADPDPLQDVCVADLKMGPQINGFICKKNFQADDFSFSGLGKPAHIFDVFGTNVSLADVRQFPGLNTLGVSMARVDYLPGGLNTPHTHPRATEIFFVLEGEIDAAFITTDDVLVSQHLVMGDIFVIPRGLVHFQINTGKGPAAIIVAFNSQMPGTQTSASTLFGATPPVSDVVLAKAFQIDTVLVEKIKYKFAHMK